LKTRVIGVLLLAAGVVLLFISNYITNQVLGGKEQVASAQGKVNSANSWFSGNPVSQQVGKGLTSGAQGQINAGEAEIARYEEIASSCKVGGYALIVVGAGVLIFSFVRKKR
jgi:hypothetical protein